MKTGRIANICIHLIFFIGVLPIWTNGGIFTRDALYTSKDDVILVNVTTFNSTVYGRSHAWLFQFFNQWCGHCVQFSKTYIQLSSMVKPWRSVISLGAIDCADSANLEICRQFGAIAFPTLKFFPTKMNENDFGKLYEGQRTIKDLKQSMLDFVSSDVARPVDAWPNLLSISDLDEENMWDHVPSNINHASVTLESDKSYMGREIILGTMHLQGHVSVFRGQKSTSKFKNVQLTEEPIILIRNRKGSQQVYVDKDNSVMGYIQYLEDYAANYTKWSAKTKEEELIHSNNDGKKSQTSHQNIISVNSDKGLEIDFNQVYLQDIENVIHYIYRQEVALHQMVSGVKLEALKSFTSILAKYLPVRKKAKNLLCHLNAWLEEQKDEITSAQLKNKLVELQIKYKYKLISNNWIGCKGSQLFYRGYPCGLWTTFHVLTVNYYQISGKDKDFNPLEVLSAVRGYVMNFFSCERCVKHFTKMSEKLSKEVNSPDTSVLWLWQAHNKVNARLKGDETEDPYHPKQQYPTETLCPNCRHYADDGNFQWNLDGVLAFLLNHYSEESVLESTASVDQDTNNISPSDVFIDTSHLQQDAVKYLEFKNSRTENEFNSPSILNSWGLGKADISLCIFIYISSICLLFVCYFYILTRRRHWFGGKKRMISPCNF